MKPKPHPDQRKLTPWIPGIAAPLSTRPGIYQRLVNGEACWARWDGNRWFQSHKSQVSAEGMSRVSSYQDRYPWRGISDPRTIDPSQPKG